MIKVTKDWREKNPLLLKSVLKDLAKYGFQIYNNTNGLSATKGLKRTSPSDCKLIFVFPQKYPLQDIRAFIQSEQLFIGYLKRPIKHIYVSDFSLNLEKIYGQGIVEICLRGSWNNLDYTNVKNVLNQSLGWFRDYNLGETFPEDFNLPEGTLFFPLERDVSICVPGFFLKNERKYFSEDSYGTFTLEFLDIAKKGILKSITHFTIEDTFISATQNENVEIDQLLKNVLNKNNPIEIEGIWLYTSVPPSVIAHGRHVYSVPIEKLTYLYNYLKKNNARISLHKENDFIICFFFELYNRKECLFLVVDFDKKDNIFDGCKYILPQKLTDEELYVRAGSTIKLQKIKDAKLLCIGLGAIGSQSTLNLARMGFKNFTLIDKENLVVGNIMRHQANINDVGKSKVEAVKKLIGKVSPFAQCTEFPYNILDNACELERMNFDIAVSAIADDRLETYVNEQMINLSKTCVYGRTTDTAYACRVVRVIPRKDPCLTCLSYYSKFGVENYIQLSNEINQYNADEYIKFEGCMAPSFVGVNLDVQLYANLLSRIVFETSGCGEQKFYIQRESNQYIYSTRTVHNEPKISNAHTLIEQTFLRLNGCPTCGNKNYPYTTIVIFKDVLDKIKNLAQKAKKVETGGVLIGAKCKLEYDTKPCLIITNATLPGPRAIKEPAYFERDVKYCAEMVQCYYEFSEKKLNYVGEWHSHTSLSVTPSNLDHSSLQKIVLDKKYVVEFPVSIIQSAIDKNITDFGVYTKKGYYADNFIISDGINIPKELKGILIEDLDPYAR